MKKFIAGNWKMNGALAANETLVKAILAGIGAASCDAAVCVPAPYLAQMQGLLAGSNLSLGAQDVSAHDAGAFTGEVSAVMLREFGVRHVIVGHSERRQYHEETDTVVASSRMSRFGPSAPARRPARSRRSRCMRCCAIRSRRPQNTPLGFVSCTVAA